MTLLTDRQADIQTNSFEWVKASLFNLNAMYQKCSELREWYIEIFHNPNSKYNTLLHLSNNQLIHDYSSIYFLIHWTQLCSWYNTNFKSTYINQQVSQSYLASSTPWASHVTFWALLLQIIAHKILATIKHHNVSRNLLPQYAHSHVTTLEQH